MENTIKKIGKVALVIFILLYGALAIMLTLCLFNLNQQGLAVFENVTTVIPLRENYSNEYKEGDLVIVKKDSVSDNKVEVGDGIFYYATEENYSVEYGVVSNIVEDSGDAVYVVGKDYNVYFNTFIGHKITNLGHFGGAYKVLTSQFGYLALVILPTLIAVVVEIYAVIMEVVAIKNDIKGATATAKPVRSEEDIIREYEAKKRAEAASVRTEEDIIREYEAKKRAEAAEAERLAAEAARPQKTEEDLIREYEERRRAAREETPPQDEVRTVRVEEEPVKESKIVEQKSLRDILKEYEEKKEPQSVDEIIKEFEEKLKTTDPKDRDELIKTYEEKIKRFEASKKN